MRRSLDPAIYDLGIPIFGICYGAQLIALQLGGEVGRGLRGEYGRAKLEVTDGPTELLYDLPSTHDVWMSHFDAVTKAPEGFIATASTADAPVAALESASRKIWAVQFHPEVVHSPHGMVVLQRFLHDLAGCPPTWTMDSIIDTQVAAIRAQVGDARAICALSGGVDSAVAAALVHKAIGQPADMRLRRHRTDAARRERPDRRDVSPQPGHRTDPRRRRQAVLRASRRGDRSREPSARRSATSSSECSRRTSAV